MAINKDHKKDSIQPTSNILIISAVGSLLLPVGTSSQRPFPPLSGMIRYNITTNKFEVFSSSWQDLRVGSYVESLNISGSAGVFVSSNIVGENYSYEIKLTDTGITPGSYTKLTINEQGRATFGTSAFLSELNPPTSNVNLGNKRIINLGNPVNSSDAVTKEYVDNYTSISVSSLGSGVSLSMGVSGNREIILRTITGGGIVEVSSFNNVISISASRSIIETSSLGGVSLGLFVSAGIGNSNEIMIKGLMGGGIIEVTALSNVIVISASQQQVTITNSSLGTGIGIINNVSGNEILSRSLLGGGNIEVSALSNGTIIISANNQLSLSSISNGVQVISNVSGREIIQRSIQGKGIVDVRVSSNGSIIVSAISTDFVESNFRLISQRNFFSNPGLLTISSDLSSYNEVYITFFNVFPAVNGPLAFRMRINGVWVTTGNLYRFNSIIITNGSGGTGITNANQTRFTGNLDSSFTNRMARSSSGYIRFFSPNNLNLVSAGTSWISEMRYISPSNEEVYFKTIGRNLYSTSTGTKFEGVQLYIDASTTTIQGGLVKVYGRL